MGFKILQDSSWKKSFGGTLVKSNPKFARPISLKRPLHLVMHSHCARGSRSMLSSAHANGVERILQAQARRFGVHIYRYANSGNHLHLVIKPRSREAYRSFIRSVSGLIPRLILKAEKSAAKGIKFWTARPFTRIVEWGRDYLGLSAYLTQNRLESLGFAKYQPRWNSS